MAGVPVPTIVLPTDWKTASPVGRLDYEHPGSASPYFKLLKPVSTTNTSIFSHHLHIYKVHRVRHTAPLLCFEQSHKDTPSLILHLRRHEVSLQRDCIGTTFAIFFPLLSLKVVVFLPTNLIQWETGRISLFFSALVFFLISKHCLRRTLSLYCVHFLIPNENEHCKKDL